MVLCGMGTRARLVRNAFWHRRSHYCKMDFQSVAFFVAAVLLDLWKLSVIPPDIRPIALPKQPRDATASQNPVGKSSMIATGSPSISKGLRHILTVSRIVVLNSKIPYCTVRLPLVMQLHVHVALSIIHYQLFSDSYGYSCSRQQIGLLDVCG